MVLESGGQKQQYIPFEEAIYLMRHSFLLFLGFFSLLVDEKCMLRI